MNKKDFKVLDSNIRKIIHNDNKDNSYFKYSDENEDERIIYYLSSSLDNMNNLVIHIKVIREYMENIFESRDLDYTIGSDEMIPYDYFNTLSSNFNISDNIVNILSVISMRLNNKFIFQDKGIPMFLCKSGRISQIYTL